MGKSSCGYFSDNLEKFTILKNLDAQKWKKGSEIAHQLVFMLL